MDEVTVTNIPERTLETIAAEIAVIKAQTQKILLVTAVEIGQRLLEAKEKIPYGEFTAWVEDALQYSETKAYNLIHIAEEYGPGLSAGVGGKTTSFANLGYSQALVLLAIPETERAEFIAGLDIENMAVRELRQAVNERNSAVAEKAKLQKAQDEQSKKIFQLSSELREAKSKKSALWNEQEKVIKLQRELDAYQDESMTARRIAKAEHELKLAKNNQATAQADARFKLVAKGFDDLFAAVKDLSTVNPEAFYQYLRHTRTFLEDTTKIINKMEKAKL
jgi:hypothetical protein